VASPDLVDVALVLAVDVSSSIDNGDFALQMQGIAKALRQKDVFDAIQAGPAQAIALILMQWSTSNKQSVFGPWRVVHTAADLEAAAQAVESAPRDWQPGATGLAAGLIYATDLFDRLPVQARKRMIDVSGDGVESDGGNVVVARAAALARAITINGLPMMAGSPLIADYYAQLVIGGDGCFIEPARNILDFADAMHRKLLREISSQVT